MSFVACDMPDANSFTVGIMALLAQKEREDISRRTKEALQAAKARGQKLGNPNGTEHIRHRGNQGAAAAIRHKADEYAETLRPTLEQLTAEGQSLNGIAKALNDRHIQTARGEQWRAKTVANILDRLSLR